ncbi:hypothetical protein ANCCAN_29579 [Ancylostoma caninum]|uniref:Uncharacterized protein n=1 Tax=Ancylostoma caninum TaxID=29170 RepID=A0A368F126_ANCCA|nr:hypothetical protein ANCCAN_29579 [Ancylostoma caninum]
MLIAGIHKEMPAQEASWTPSCSYTVRKWPNGPLVGTVVLGQTDNCLVVRSCSVVAGETNHELIGADGCSKNTKILPHLTYFNPSRLTDINLVFYL